MNHLINTKKERMLDTSCGSHDLRTYLERLESYDRKKRKKRKKMKSVA